MLVPKSDGHNPKRQSTYKRRGIIPLYIILYTIYYMYILHIYIDYIYIYIYILLQIHWMFMENLRGIVIHRNHGLNSTRLATTELAKSTASDLTRPNLPGIVVCNWAEKPWKTQGFSLWVNWFIYSYPLDPSGKLSHNYGKSPFSMGKSTINGPLSIAM